MVYRNNTGRLGFWLHQCVLRNTLAGSKTVVSTSRNHPVEFSYPLYLPLLATVVSRLWPHLCHAYTPFNPCPILIHYILLRVHWHGLRQVCVWSVNPQPWRFINNSLGLIWIAFIIGNSSLEPLREGLFAQIHVNLSWRVFGQNWTGDLLITRFLKCCALHHGAKVTDKSPKILQDPWWSPSRTFLVCLPVSMSLCRVCMLFSLPGFLPVLCALHVLCSVLYS